MTRRHCLAFVLAACAAKQPQPQPLHNNGPRSDEHPPIQQTGGPDRDGDGIADTNDKCPDDPEDFDGFDDEDGCPDPDNDRDGIGDVDDICPNEPESRNGNADDDGCPD
jgi:hypothetical protein